MRIYNPAMGFACMLCFISCMLINISLATGTICYDTGNFTTNSTYEKNRNLILSSLASNVILHDGFFYNATIGHEPDKVYALVLCRGDSSSDQCTTCVSSTTQAIMTVCLNQKEAVAWGESPQCIIRYSNRSIFGKMEADPMAGGSYENNMTTNMTQFDQNWQSFMDRLVRKASTGSHKSRRNFATGEANLTHFVKIYALVQCTPDISESDCDYCLRQSMNFERTRYIGKPGSIIVRPSCIYMTDWSPFYEPSPDDSSPASPPPQSKKGGIASRTVVIIVVSTVIFKALVAFAYVIFQRKKKAKWEIFDPDEIEAIESLQFDFNTIKAATNNFLVDSKLGRGGFGVVYKGSLPDGHDIAVKRLSRDSRQGELEFKNEVLLVATLQHRNLVRLLGFCLKENERLLIYEFLPNSSLDNYIFDPTKHSLLDWQMRYKIIEGIAWGILDLHEDSSGYMAPEYIKHGHFSVKSDVFSFGVLVLEIISGQKNSCFPSEEEPQGLLTYAWRNWDKGTAMNPIDPILRVGSCSEMLRCIHIGLLCVQEKVASRPTMASVVLMLTSCSLSLPVPSKPAFFMHSNTELDNPELPVLDQSKNYVEFSVNEASITKLEPQ